jgi:RNA polymerase sigma-70 factor (ECF subfamily)
MLPAITEERIEHEREREREAAEPAVSRLVERAQAGDRGALRELLLEVQPRVRNLVRYLVPGDSDVDDYAQEALVALIRGLPTFRGEGTLEAWVGRVSARAVFAALRKRRRDSELPPAAQPQPVPSTDERPDAYIQRRRLVRLVDTLPAEQRSALVLHHVLGMSIPEVASELAVPNETARSRLRLGMAKLRSMMTRLDAGENDD